jgi:hypothetical protein
MTHATLVWPVWQDLLNPFGPRNEPVQIRIALPVEFV